ncbi:hypothetical protein N1031_08610 [Herbiconiux moechotypicola]|uniref:Integral membrane protein n=1 Tax=Herbiconiux moechotypicola TaxID=637393 RepID=A0ABP5QDK4_9MICO|nr:hypothetical protein [Herbiconiux moechotypicola]MCS5729820.1 hypothetical protein [Herbiconiux moechotypicola]
MSDAELSGPEFTGESPLEASPWEIKLSFGLWLAEAILGIIAGVVVAIAGGLVGVVVADTPEVGLAAGVFVAVGVVMIALAVFRIVCAAKLLRGRPWARNALTILGVIGLLGVVLEFQSNPSIAIAHGLLAVVAIVTMYLPNSNAYIRRPFPSSSAL